MNSGLEGQAFNVGINGLKGKPMPKSRRKTEIIAGAFVLASLALLLMVVVFLGRHENIFEARYRITGRFNSVGGLQTGADVRLAGISVGYVDAIEFGPQKNVSVKMSVKRSEQNRIRADSAATIRTMGLMGDRYIEISLGSPHAPVIADGGVIKTGQGFDLADLAEIAEPAVQDLAKVIHNVLLLTDRLAARSNEVGTIVDNIADLTNNLKQVSEDLKAAGPRVGPLLQSAQSGITEARALFRDLEHSWLLGGAMPNRSKESPIAIDGRDRSDPPENK